MNNAAATTSPAPAPNAPSPDYGLDAPYVVRNLLGASGAALVLWIGAALHAWSGVVRVPLPGGHALLLNFVSAALPCAASFAASGVWMLYAGRSGKRAERERLLDNLSWRGDEVVLDIGCGRGLLVVGAARRLTTGRATGIDIWRAQDLSDNKEGAVSENARREGVADRVAVQNANMRALPFPDGTFDVVVSRAVIHSLAAPGRDQTIGEIARVLKPGGRALISDIRHGSEYARALARHGVRDVCFLGSPLTGVLWSLVTLGALRPAIFTATKPATASGERGAG